MQEITSKKLNKILSSEKMEAYNFRNKGASDKELYAHYLWNIQLSEALYPLLQGVEIALRNGICNAIMIKYNLNFYDFCNNNLQLKEQNKVNSIKKEFIKIKKVFSNGNLIESLSFGFWTALFDARYEHNHILWPHLLKSTFPHAKNSLCKRKEISKKLNKIRRLRNRIFHHGSIWHWKDLEIQHELIIETLKWLSPEFQLLILEIDRFSEVYKNGYLNCLKSVNTLNGNKND